MKYINLYYCLVTVVALEMAVSGELHTRYCS